MLRTKFKYENKQIKGNNSKNKQTKLQFMCTALPLDEISPPKKFHNHSKYSFGDMLRTKFKSKNKQRAITPKLSKQELRFMYTQLPLYHIYPPTKFHNHS